jgi:hypothetical protein
VEQSRKASYEGLLHHGSRLFKKLRNILPSADGPKANSRTPSTVGGGAVPLIELHDCLRPPESQDDEPLIAMAIEPHD